MAAFLAELGFMLGLLGLLSHSSHSQFTSYLPTYPRTLILLFFRLIALILSCLRLLYGTVASLPVIKFYKVFQNLTESAEHRSSCWVRAGAEDVHQLQILLRIGVTSATVRESKIHFKHQMKIYWNPHRQKNEPFCFFICSCCQGPLLQFHECVGINVYTCVSFSLILWSF